MSFSSKISKQRLHILTFQIRPLIWQLAFILLEFWEPLVITLQMLLTVKDNAITIDKFLYTI
ncbi:hypothetical protein CUMW_176440 [Citrus unshiu]|uniref:Uncharacterized protein n=1 Tax=Citrus unshiu TaxID=55188 RepID=A0A2H5PXE8_CITUN|nr:hypothetical protein CUMW_176440 [Citrus unshiu]